MQKGPSTAILILGLLCAVLAGAVLVLVLVRPAGNVAGSSGDSRQHQPGSEFAKLDGNVGDYNAQLRVIDQSIIQNNTEQAGYSKAEADANNVATGAAGTEEGLQGSNLGLRATSAALERFQQWVANVHVLLLKAASLRAACKADSRFSQRYRATVYLADYDRPYQMEVNGGEPFQYYERR